LNVNALHKFPGLFRHTASNENEVPNDNAFVGFVNRHVA